MTRICFRPIFGSMPRAEILRGQQFVQVDGDVRKSERVIFARHATAEVTQQLIVDLRKAVSSTNSMPAKPFDPEERGEYVLEHLHARFEAFEDLVDDAGTACHSALRTSTP